MQKRWAISGSTLLGIATLPLGGFEAAAILLGACAGMLVLPQPDASRLHAAARTVTRPMRRAPRASTA